MMTAKQKVPEHCFNSDEIKTLENRAKNGDVASMTALTADAIRFYLNDPEVMEYRKELVLEAEHGSDRNVLRNAAILAAYLEDLKTTSSIVDYLITRDDMSTAAHIADILLKSDSEEPAREGLRCLKLAAKKGHVWSKSQYLRYRVKKWGVLGQVIWILYLPYIFGSLAFISLKDSKDFRLRYD